MWLATPHRGVEGRRTSISGAVCALRELQRPGGGGTELGHGGELGFGDLVKL